MLSTLNFIDFFSLSLSLCTWRSHLGVESAGGGGRERRVFFSDFLFNFGGGSGAARGSLCMVGKILGFGSEARIENEFFITVGGSSCECFCMNLRGKNGLDDVNLVENGEVKVYLWR